MYLNKKTMNFTIVHEDKLYSQPFFTIIFITSFDKHRMDVSIKNISFIAAPSV